ncbi:hypothetical protein DPMN_018725 [Dreissena polymorpha]|uniref:Uncharacterized protein n=1 Tax=Dreissena polymorpha TaxID=45954 RepID=A0A9D4NJU3_DREPO|nr:hypothetical protein DPMN_018725 [Dreissena polymorpha]
MSRQRPTRLLVMGRCIVEIGRIVNRKVQYQLEVNQCRNEEGRPRVGNGPCIVEIDRIVIRELQYQFEVNWCRNEEVIAKAILGGCSLCGQCAPWLVMVPCIVEIDRIVIREVQYQFEVNRCRNEEILVKSNYGWLWSKWAGPCIVEIDRIVIREVQYQLEVNQCNFGWVWPMWEGRPRVGNGPCIVKIDRIVIRELQYQFEVNQCRNEEVICAPWLVMGPCIVEIDRIVVREVQYQFEENRCRKEEVIQKMLGTFFNAREIASFREIASSSYCNSTVVKGNFGWVWSMWVQYQFEVNRCRNEEVNFQGSNSGQDGRTDRRRRFSKSVWITRKNATAMYQKAYASS